MFNRNASFSGVPISIPCGQCIGCRLERSRQWACRCLHEKRMHAESCFLTLTYSPENMPAFGSLVKRDLVLFMKRLRKKVGQVRFYACGEYGDQSWRPHYHVLLFGYDFRDKKFYKNAKRGEKLYTSKLLEEIWGKGLCVIGEVTFDSAAYVARYVMKKVTGDHAPEYYSVVDEWGEVHDIQPEFTNMSRRPGIGATWYAKYGEHAYQHDSVIMNGVEVRPPRFYDTRYDLFDSTALARIKQKRRRVAMALRGDNSSRRRLVKEMVLRAKLNLKGGVV